METNVLEVPGVREAHNALDSAEGELVLDFSSVRRIDSNSLRALEGLACAADAKSVKIVLRGIDVNVYKVLKLMKLTHRFSFVG
jgi:anti-anti-sigma regulatory factor